MNKICERSHPTAVPLTPNLEQYKLHGRTKPKKKAIYPLQPTIQPLQNQIERSPTNSKIAFCQNHPDKKGLFFRRDNSKKGLCGFCAICDGGGDSKFLDEEKYEKTNSIEEFKSKVEFLRNSIESKEAYIFELLNSEEEQYQEYIAYMNESFKSILKDIEEKHNELNNCLLESIEKRKKSIVKTTETMNDIKNSIERYILDINKNYDEIIMELSIDNFTDIMNQYNVKIEYFHENLKKIHQDLANSNSINIYLPFQEMRRVINKASIKYMGLDVEKIISNRSLDKFTSSGSHAGENKNSKIFDKTKKIIMDRHDRKSESKAGQKKRNTITNIHQIRGANKENNNFDSYYNYNEQ